MHSIGLGSKIDYSGGDDAGAPPAEPTPPPAKPAPKKAAPRKPPPPPPKPEPAVEEPAEEPIGGSSAPSAFGGPSIGDDAPTKGAKTISDEEAELVRAYMITTLPSECLTCALSLARLHAHTRARTRAPPPASPCSTTSLAHSLTFLPAGHAEGDGFEHRLWC